MLTGGDIKTTSNRNVVFSLNPEDLANNFILIAVKLRAEVLPKITQPRAHFQSDFRPPDGQKQGSAS